MLNKEYLEFLTSIWTTKLIPGNNVYFIYLKMCMFKDAAACLNIHM